MNREVDLLHIAYGGVGGHLADVNILNEGLVSLGIQTAVLGVTESKSRQVHERTWRDTLYVPVFPSHPKDLFPRWSMRRVIGNLRPRVILAHSHGLIPEIEFHLLTQGIPSRLVVRETHATQLRSRKDNLRSYVALRFAKGLIFLSERQYRDYPLRIPERLRKPVLAVIPNAVHSKVGYPHSESITAPTDVVLGMASRLVRGKRVDLIISAMAALRREGIRVCLRVAGDGPERSRFEHLAEMQLEEDQYEFLGNIAPEDMDSFYRSLAIYLQLTDGEGDSNAVLEAASHGLPVLLSEGAGLATNSGVEVGLVRVPNSIDAIAKELARLLGDSAELRRLGTLNANYVNTERSPHRAICQYLDLLAGVDPGGPWAAARARL